MKNKLSRAGKVLLWHEKKHGFSETEYWKQFLKFLLVSNAINGSLMLYNINEVSIKREENEYKFKIQRFANPLIFSVLFKIPVMLGLGMGLAGNYI